MILMRTSQQGEEKRDFAEKTQGEKKKSQEWIAPSWPLSMKHAWPEWPPTQRPDRRGQAKTLRGPR